MILYNKLYEHLISTKIKRKVDHIDHVKKILKDNGFTDREIVDVDDNGMKENRVEIFKLKKKLVKFKKKQSCIKKLK